MKEQEPINIELTNKSNLPRLEGERNFMPEPGRGETPPADNSGENREEPQENLSLQEQINRGREAIRNSRESIREAALSRGQVEAPEIEDPVKEFQKKFGEGIRVILHGQSLDDPNVADELENFLYYADKTKQLAEAVYEDSYRPVIERLRELKSQGNISEIKRILPDFSKEIREHFVSAEAVAPDIPESLEDLAVLIMKSESAQWKTGGKKELVDYEGRVNKENFLAWARKRMIEVHEFSPTETVDFFSRIFVKSRWSQVNLADMVLTGSYFLEKREETLLKPPTSNPEDDLRVKRTTLHKNDDYEALKNELLLEAFLFNTSRNNHVEYVANQFNEPELSKTIYKLYTPNTFTRSNFLETIMSMPSMRQAQGEVLQEGREIQDKLEKNFGVGQATRRLLLAYYYIYDHDMLKKLFTKDDIALFTQEYDEIDADGNIKGKKKGTNKEGNTGEAYDRSSWYDSEGKIKINDPKVRREYLKFINVFTAPGPQKSEAIISEVRERMVQSVMQEMGLDYDEAKYAEAWAFSMTKWTGLAAKNDTGAVGHDAWTKALNVQEYRLRQMAEHRNALYGNIFNMLGIKRLGLNWFEGIRDEKGRTIIEVIQGGEGSDINIKQALRELPTKVTFAENSMRGFASNHIMNSFTLLEFLIDHNGFNFQNMLTFDVMGRPVIDYEKANKIIDGVDKAIRYWASTWGGTDYSKKVRTWETEITEEDNSDYKTGKIKREDPVAKNMPILMELFGPEIVKILKRQAEEVEAKKLAELTDEGKAKRLAGKKEKQKVWNMSGVGEVDVAEIQASEMRQLLWKGVFEYLVKAEIESHRNVFSDQERFNMLKMQAIYAFIKEKGILTESEINELRKITHTTEFGMFLTEGGGGALAGGLLGALKGFRSTTGKLTKV